MSEKKADKKKKKRTQLNPSRILGGKTSRIQALDFTSESKGPRAAQN